MKAAAAAGACAAVGAGAGIVGSAAAPSSKSKPGGGEYGFFRRGFGLRHPGVRPFGIGGPPVHAQAVILNKAGNGFVTATEDSGTIKSVSGNDVTISEGVGSVHYQDQTVTIPSGATIYRNGAKASVSDLKTGDEIHVTSSSNGTFVVAGDAQHARFGPGRLRGGPPPPGGPPPGPGAGPYGWR